MTDDIRPMKTIEVQCERCGWHFWLESLSAQLPSGPFLCPDHDDSAPVTEKAELR